MNLKASDSWFFDETVSCVKVGSPQTNANSVNRPIRLIIENFDTPALRILYRLKSTRLALKVIGFFDDTLLLDVSGLDDRLFAKIILFSTHQPIGMNTKSVLKKILVEMYPYGSKEICTKFFFFAKDSGEDESKVNELSKICGQYNIDYEGYFHPGCVINYKKVWY